MRPITYRVTNTGDGVPIPLDIFRDPFAVTLACVVSGGPTYSVEFTCDDPANVVTWFPLANLTAKVANASDTLISPVTAVRLRVTAVGAPADYVEMRVLQAGLPS
jgi:hypothetical protein